MNSIIPFTYESFQIRVILDANGNPWWVAKDVCEALGIQNPTQAVSRLDDDERAMSDIGLKGEVNIINEPGLYNFILRSDKPEAKQFKRWIVHDVLPAIRKTGSYSIPGAQAPDYLAQLRRQRMQINEECALIKAQRRLERTAKD